MRHLKNNNPYILVLPILIFIIFLTIYPTIYTIRLSLFSTMAGINNIRFVGLNNFINLFKSSIFWNSFKITCLFTVTVVIIELVLGFTIALLLKKVEKGRTLFRLLFIIPLAISPAIAGLTWRMMYSQSFGIINYLLSKIGITGILWHTGYKTALLSVIIVDVWQWTPFVMIIAYAALQMIPKEMHDASLVDGCNNISSFFKISLPYVRPITIIIIIFRALDAFKAFDLIFILTKGGPGRSTDTLVISSFIDAFYNMDLGRASAISVILLLVSIFISKKTIKLII